MSADQRQRVIDVARTWLRTPYHHMGRVKGVGVDCATLLCEVFEEAGVTPHVDLEHYPADWMLHRDEERYLQQITRYAAEVAYPTGPGDLVLVKFGRCFSHAAIVVDWPLCIHAMTHHPVGYVDAHREGSFHDAKGELRPMKFFTMWSR